LQQVGTGVDVQRRASQSPAPRPVLTAASPTTSRILHPGRRRLGRKLKFQLQTLALAAVGVIAFLVFSGLARPLNSPAPALAEIERIIELAGFGLTQVSLTGQRYTPDSDIFDAIGLESAHTLLSFDSRTAQNRIESLPWVERASIERVLPDRLEVRVSERAPSAVWRLGNRNFLIDKSGRVLTAVPADAMPSLLRVAGEGAAAEASRLYALLADCPDLMARVDVAERIGGRRWTLRLANGGVVQLPAQGEAEAIARALRVANAFASEASEIDVRVPQRTLVREPEGRKMTMGPEARRVTGGI
jgi:cell division protein FtsQ